MKYEWYNRILFAIYTVILICQDKNSLNTIFGIRPRDNEI